MTVDGRFLTTFFALAGSLTGGVDVTVGAGMAGTVTLGVELFWLAELTATSLFFLEQPVAPAAIISKAATIEAATLRVEPIRPVVPEADRSVFAFNQLMFFMFITSAACAVKT